MATPTKKTKTKQIVARRNRGWWRVHYVAMAPDGVTEMYTAQGRDLVRAVCEIGEKVAARQTGADQ
jgi:hypothetical protein